MAKDQTKVLVIGLSKTGTSTLKAMLTDLSYRVCGPRKDLLREVRNENFAALNPVLEAYDAFEDWPWPLAYRYALELYGPNVKFILTTRIDESKWLSSITNHGYGMGLFKSMNSTYGYYRPFGKEKEFLNIYNNHNAEVRAFFTDYPNQFLEFCLEKGDGWDKLCAFLNAPIQEKRVPHRNKTTSGRKIIAQYLNRLVAIFYRKMS